MSSRQIQIVVGLLIVIAIGVGLVMIAERNRNIIAEKLGDVSIAGVEPAEKPGMAEAPGAPPMKEASEVEPEPESQPPKETADGPRPLPPSFDVARFEPAGDGVLAGQAAPGAVVEVLANDDPIATTTASDVGEWVIVLETPLTPGNYDIALRSTRDDGETTMSEEFIAVVIPEKPSGEVLVVASRAGQASEILARPGADESQKIQAAEERSETPATDDSQQAARAIPPESAAEQTAPQFVENAETETPAKTALPGETAKDAMQATAQAAAEPDDGGGVKAEAEMAGAGETKMAAKAGSSAEEFVRTEEAEAADAAEKPAEQEAGAGVADAAEDGQAAARKVAETAQPADGQEPEVGADEQAAIEIAGAETRQTDNEESTETAAAAPAEADKPVIGQNAASAPPDAAGAGSATEAAASETAARSESAGVAKVTTEADEAERESRTDASSEVAETAIPAEGKTVRSDRPDEIDTALKTEEAEPSPREAAAEERAVSTPPSDVTVSADKPAPDSEDKAPAEATDVAAATPSRESGETPEAPTVEVNKTAKQDRLQAAGPDVGEKTATVEKPDYGAIDDKPLSEQKVSAQDAREPEMKVAAAEPEEQQAAPLPAKPQTVVRLALDAVETEGRMVYAAGTGNPGSRVRIYVDNSLIGETVANGEGRWLLETPAEIPAGDVVVRADELEKDSAEVTRRAEVPFVKEVDAIALLPSSATAGGGASQSAEQARITGPKSVIIRSGDNLWTISRRVYGRGIRYTTIYKANDDQIRNPHWIYPGQVFVIPEAEKGWVQQ